MAGIGVKIIFTAWRSTKNAGAGDNCTKRSVVRFTPRPHSGRNKDGTVVAKTTDRAMKSRRRQHSLQDVKSVGYCRPCTVQHTGFPAALIVHPLPFCGLTGAAARVRFLLGTSSAIAGDTGNLMITRSLLRFIAIVQRHGRRIFRRPTRNVLHRRPAALYDGEFIPALSMSDAAGNHVAGCRKAYRPDDGMLQATTYLDQITRIAEGGRMLTYYLVRKAWRIWQRCQCRRRIRRR